MEMNQPIGATPLDGRSDGLVGRPIDRVDGRLKVSGRAPYADEVREPRAPAYGFIVGATVARGTIRSMQVSQARRAPGVLYVMTHETVPKQGERREQVWPQLQGTEIRFFGQPVAFVVAETFEQARAAAMLVKVRYDAAKPKGLLKDSLAAAVFDAHLCVAEYMLYGPVPYAEVIAQAEDLRSQAKAAQPGRIGSQNVASRWRKTAGTATVWSMPAATSPAIRAASRAPRPPGVGAAAAMAAPAR